MDTRDYDTYDTVCTIAGRRALFVRLHTKEFGDLCSRAIFSDKPILYSDIIIWDGLAEEVINDYEARLKIAKKERRGEE